MVTLGLLILQPVLAVVGFCIIRFNDLRHLAQDMQELRKLVLDHIRWHAERI